jgi:2',3'-cyclic-nucleotide 2'-phosphodiesterase (5'-nucleotidase family)
MRCIIAQKGDVMRTKLVFALVLVVCFAVGLLGCARKTSHLTILYLNDLHGHLESFKKNPEDQTETGGMARIAGIVDQVRREVEAKGGHVVLLYAGDVLQGTPMSLVFKGEPDIQTMNAMKFDAMVLGNHEFDYGQANLKRLMSLATFPMMSANIKTTAGKGFAIDYIINSYDKLKVAIFGLTTDETPVTSHPDSTKDLEFVEPIEAAKKVVPTLRGKADIVIALTHLGYDVDKRLAQEVPGIDVIVGGHSHTKVETPARVGKTLVCQAYEYGAYLGRIDLEVLGKRIVRSDGYLIAIGDTIPQDPRVADLVSSYATRLEKELDGVVGVSSLPLDGDRAAIRSRETNLGDLVADAMRTRTGTDIALINAGSIRAGIDRGDITVREILTALPFEDQSVTLTLTGRQVSDVLNRSAAMKPGSGGFLQVSGVNFTIYGGKAISINVSGEPLDDKKTYAVVTNDFLAAGGDGYEVFKKGSNSYRTEYKISDIVLDYVRGKKTVGAKVENRILRK